MSGRIPICVDPDADDFTLDSPAGHCNWCTLQYLSDRYETKEPWSEMKCEPYRWFMLELRPKNRWIEVYLVEKDKYDMTVSETWKASFMGLTIQCAC